MMSLTLAMAATFVSEHYGAPVMLMALLLGMAFSFQSEEGRCIQGIQFTSTRLLKIGVALLGFRVSLSELFSLGAVPLVIIPIFVVSTIAVGVGIARLFGKDTVFGLLTGGAVAICGASAALALAAVLPKGKHGEQNTLFTVVAVTTLSTIAMILYPILFNSLGFSDHQTGFLIGATIHDVAQVVGAGYAVSEDAGNTATYVKMIRVALLPIVVGAFVLMGRSRDQNVGDQIPMPWFALGFAVFLLVNSLNVVPDILVQAANSSSQWLLVTAIAALGMKVSLGSMFALGSKNIGIVVTQTLFLLAIATLAVWVLIP